MAFARRRCPYRIAGASSLLSPRSCASPLAIRGRGALPCSRPRFNFAPSSRCFATSQRCGWMRRSSRSSSCALFANVAGPVSARAFTIVVSSCSAVIATVGGVSASSSRERAAKYLASQTRACRALRERGLEPRDFGSIRARGVMRCHSRASGDRRVEAGSREKPGAGDCGSVISRGAIS